jgi:peptidase M28-like protein
VQASPGYDDAARWLVGQLESFGYDPETENVPADGRTRLLGQLMPEGWDCARATAMLVDGGSRERLCDYEAEKLSLILRSDPARGRFPIVALADGTEDAHYDPVNVRGAVVLTDGAVQRVHQLAVVERGAAGLLYDGRRLLPPVRDRFDDPGALAYTSFWWNEDEPRGWGFVLSPRAGARVRERLAAGRGVELEVEIESRRFATTIPLISARLPGTRPGEVLIVSHLCHPQPSANDNASGAAANLEAARTLAALRDRGALAANRRSVRFLWVPELAGTYAWLGRDQRRARDTVAAVNLDMVGQYQERCGSTFLLEHPPCFAASFAEELLLRIREQAVDWVPSYSGPGHYSMTRMAEVPYSGGSDHVVFVDPATGVPCPMLIQWPDRYYHSSLDTPDKTDPGSLALALRCAATYAAFLAQSGEAEGSWLLDMAGRGARRRLLAAADAPDRARSLARERLAGHAAIASLARVGMSRARIEDASAALDAFAEREAATPEDASGPVGVTAPGAQRIPRRSLPVPIHYQRHLLEGWRGLPRETREAWRRREQAMVDGLVLADLAWYACDGRRNVEQIARLVWLETGRHEPDYVEQFFDTAARLGLCGWAESGTSAPRPAATPTTGR